MRILEDYPLGGIVRQFFLVPERFCASFEIDRMAEVFLPRENPGDRRIIPSVRAVTV